jgi:hypothetical protein
MIFPYRSIISEAPDGRDYLLIHRPEVPITILGSAASGTYVGLVDTGSDNTILPKSIADDLGIATQATTGPAASVFGGSRVELLAGKAILRLEAESTILTWETAVYFFDFPSADEETLILGHAGFLEYFTATFDGKAAELTLVANDDLPTLAQHASA